MKEDRNQLVVGIVCLRAFIKITSQVNNIHLDNTAQWHSSLFIAVVILLLLLRLCHNELISKLIIDNFSKFYKNLKEREENWKRKRAAEKSKQ